jgi:hypothetical protein
MIIADHPFFAKYMCPVQHGPTLLPMRTQGPGCRELTSQSTLKASRPTTALTLFHLEQTKIVWSGTTTSQQCTCVLFHEVLLSLNIHTWCHLDQILQSCAFFTILLVSLNQNSEVVRLTLDRLLDRLVKPPFSGLTSQVC